MPTQYILRLQHLLKGHGHYRARLDGLDGKKTQAGLREYREKFALLSRTETNSLTWLMPREEPKRLERVYGKSGDEGHLSFCNLPYNMRCSWRLKLQIRRFQCNKALKWVFQGFFGDLLEHYGYENIVRLRLDIYGGCFANRRKRGGVRKSVHSYGAAIDLDPDNNRLRWDKDRASFATSEYAPFLDIAEEWGLFSLGRIKNFDWMHLQAGKPN